MTQTQSPRSREDMANEVLQSAYVAFERAEQTFRDAEQHLHQATRTEWAHAQAKFQEAHVVLVAARTRLETARREAW